MFEVPQEKELIESNVVYFRDKLRQTLPYLQAYENQKTRSQVGGGVAEDCLARFVDIVRAIEELGHPVDIDGVFSDGEFVTLFESLVKGIRTTEMIQDLKTVNLFPHPQDMSSNATAALLKADLFLANRPKKENKYKHE